MHRLYIKGVTGHPKDVVVSDLHWFETPRKCHESSELSAHVEDRPVYFARVLTREWPNPQIANGINQDGGKCRELWWKGKRRPVWCVGLSEV